MQDTKQTKSDQLVVDPLNAKSLQTLVQLAIVLKVSAETAGALTSMMIAQVAATAKTLDKR